MNEEHEVHRVRAQSKTGKELLCKTFTGPDAKTEAAHFTVLLIGAWICGSGKYGGYDIIHDVINYGSGPGVVVGEVTKEPVG